MTLLPIHPQFASMPEAVERLAAYGIDATTRTALSDFIARAADRELYHVNPRYLAEQLSLDERATLTLLVAAVAEGLMELNWQTDCPMCRHLGWTAPTLAELPELHYCQDCNHQYEIRSADDVYVAVSINENLRRLSDKDRDDLTFQALLKARYGPMPALALVDTPRFRDLLLDQVLPDGYTLKVNRLTIFFSGLHGSAALYERLGDTATYQIMRQYFDAVSIAVAEHNGAVVKTSGADILGAFAGPADALRGLHAACAAMDELSEQVGLAGDDRLSLKVGLHVGPGLMVTLNQRLDYLGQTVNLAARLSALTPAGTLALSQAVLDDAAAKAAAAELGRLRPLERQTGGLPVPLAAQTLEFAL
jgi:class 3 adenylate cyclase